MSLDVADGSTIEDLKARLSATFPKLEAMLPRVVCAIDCGTVINPDTVEAQCQSNIVYGLTATLYGEIDIDRGRVVQSNFNNYAMLRLAQMPEVEVVLVRSDNPPGGIGEAALPAIAPAVCNAMFAATGTRIRRLPIVHAG